VNKGIAFTHGLAYDVCTDDPADDSSKVFDGSLTAGSDQGPN
jgi:hypothetical protein